MIKYNLKSKSDHPGNLFCKTVFSTLTLSLEVSNYTWAICVAPNFLNKTNACWSFLQKKKKKVKYTEKNSYCFSLVF